MISSQQKSKFALAPSVALSNCLPILIILLAFALQLYGLEDKSLWFDELGTLTGAGWGGSLVDAVRTPLSIPLTPKPPLSFVITHLFLVLDESVFALRLPSVVFATLTIPLVYTIGKSLIDKQVGLLGALLLAIAPLHIRYAQEARMYELFAFLSLLSLYLFWRAIRSRRWRWWAGFIVVTVLNLYTHLFAILPLGVMTLYALGLLLSPRARVRYPFLVWHFIAALVVILLLFAPLLPYVSKGLASEEGLGGSAAQDWDLNALLSVLRLFSGGNRIGLIVYGLAFVLATIALMLKYHNVLILSLTWIGLPILVVAFLPFGHVVEIRYFIFALPIYLLLVAFGFKTMLSWSNSQFAHTWHSSAGQRTVRLLGIAVLLGTLAGISAPTTSSLYAETKQNWRGAAWLVHTLARPGDEIFVPREYHRTGVRFYAQQWAVSPILMTKSGIQIIPGDLNNFKSSLAADRGYWFIVPHKKRFLPGGELEEAIQPQYYYSTLVALTASNLPADQELIAPVSYGSVAVIRIEPSPLPPIYFWADLSSLRQGECTWLNWEIENVREIYLDGEGVVGHDKRQVCPTNTSTYNLQVLHLDDSVTVKTIEITVVTP